MSLLQQLNSCALSPKFENLYKVDKISQLLGWGKNDEKKYIPTRHYVFVNDTQCITYQGLLYVIPLYNYGNYKFEEWSKCLFIR